MEYELKKNEEDVYRSDISIKDEIADGDNKNSEIKKKLNENSEKSSLSAPSSLSSTTGNKNDSDILSFDSILNEIGFGKFQLKTYLIMGFLALSEGSQIMVFTLMIPILETEWKIEPWVNSLQASMIFISFLIGSVVSGQFADRFGRRRPCQYTSFFMCLLSFLSATSPNIAVLIFIRVFLGLLVGFFGPLAATILAEITPQDRRGKYMALISVSLSIGQVFGVAMAYAILPDLSSGNWRALIIVCTFPGVAAWILSLLFLHESPRFELSAGNYDKTYTLLNYINNQNGCKVFSELDEERKRRLRNWADKMAKAHKGEEAASVKALFKDTGRLMTPLLWGNWFTTSFIYYGIVIFMPDILEKLKNESKGQEEHDILQILMSTLTEILSVVVAALLIELRSFGRKNSMILFYALTGGASFLTFFDGDSRFIYWATLCKFLMALTFIFCFQYTSEVYSTKIRTTGIGLANGVGRFGGITMPWICVFLSEKSLLSPFLCFASLAILSSVLSFFLPFDTTGKELDSLNEVPEETRDSGNPG